MIALNTCRSLIALFLIAAALAFFSQAAGAQEISEAKLDLRIAPEAAVGDRVELQATLTAGGSPLSDAEVVFQRSVEFLNAGNDVLIGRAKTDADGVASVVYAPRSEGDILITAEFDGVAGITAAQSEFTIFVGPGPAQFFPEAGVSVPGINISFLVAILSAVWGTYFIVMFLIWLIVRDGSATPTSGGVTGE